MHTNMHTCNCNADAASAFQAIPEPGSIKALRNEVKQFMLGHTVSEFH